MYGPFISEFSGFFEITNPGSMHVYGEITVQAEAHA